MDIVLVREPDAAGWGVDSDIVVTFLKESLVARLYCLRLSCLQQ